MVHIQISKFKCSSQAYFGMWSCHTPMMDDCLICTLSIWKRRGSRTHDQYPLRMGIKVLLKALQHPKVYHSPNADGAGGSNAEQNHLGSPGAHAILLLVAFILLELQLSDSRDSHLCCGVIVMSRDNLLHLETTCLLRFQRSCVWISTNGHHDNKTHREEENLQSEENTKTECRLRALRGGNHGELHKITKRGRAELLC